jgi:hypothetical protein
MEILEELREDIYIGSFVAGGRHFWLDNLKLQRLQLEWQQLVKSDPTFTSVFVLWEASQPPSGY